MKLSAFLYLLLKDIYEWDVSETDIAYDIKDPLFVFYADKEKIVNHFISIARSIDPDFISNYCKNNDSINIDIIRNKIIIDGVSDEELSAFFEKMEAYIKEIGSIYKNIDLVNFSGSRV